MEFLTELSPIDLFIVATLAGGVFAGFTQGLIRYALNLLVVPVAFVIASQLKGPMFDTLGFWQAFTPQLREQIIFLVLFIGLVVGGWFIVRALYKRTHLPIIRQLDELGGAVLGLLFAVVTIVFLLLVMDSFFQYAPDSEVADAGVLKGFYDAMNDSVLVEAFRSTVIPTLGFLAKPFVPSEIARLLEQP
ncbi:MAG TPA: CvpA family protein [candidate division Zixibacteria bacterium]|nr:CvpA family protein [candidate division Zixibacteria bacterium]